MNNTTPTFYTLLLNLLPGVGASRYWQWVDELGSAEAVLNYQSEKLPGINKDAKTLLADFQQTRDNSALAARGYEILEVLDNQQAQLITADDSLYPPLLQQIHRPPPLLFCKGSTDLLALPQIAIVGTRNPTSGGLDNTRAFARYLAQGGFTITSGLAAGIDGAAHEAALSVNGNTIAVMGTGIDSCYPKRHQQLATRIIDNGGLLLSEFPPNTPPQPSHFPQRNRIISGLSLGVLVMEAAIKSGSLITARYGLEQNREVFAVPGSIHNPQAKGCHALIKQGAHLVETAADIVQQLSGLLHNFNQSIVSSSPKQHFTGEISTEEQSVLEQLGHDTVDMELLLQRTGFGSAELSVVLMNLEIKGVIRQSDWGYEAVFDVV